KTHTAKRRTSASRRRGPALPLPQRRLTPPGTQKRVQLHVLRQQRPAVRHLILGAAVHRRRVVVEVHGTEEMAAVVTRQAIRVEGVEGEGTVRCLLGQLGLVGRVGPGPAAGAGVEGVPPGEDLRNGEGRAFRHGWQKPRLCPDVTRRGSGLATTWGTSYPISPGSSPGGDTARWTGPPRSTRSRPQSPRATLTPAES